MSFIAEKNRTCLTKVTLVSFIALEVPFYERGKGSHVIQIYFFCQDKISLIHQSKIYLTVGLMILETHTSLIAEPDDIGGSDDLLDPHKYGHNAQFSLQMVALTVHQTHTRLGSTLDRAQGWWVWRFAKTTQVWAKCLAKSGYSRFGGSPDPHKLRLDTQMNSKMVGLAVRQTQTYLGSTLGLAQKMMGYHPKFYLFVWKRGLRKKILIHQQPSNLCVLYIKILKTSYHQQIRVVLPSPKDLCVPYRTVKIFKPR